MSTTAIPAGALELHAITTDVGQLLARVQAFREEHPVGHTPCAVCDHVRRKDEDHYPAGPTDVLAALHVALWNFDNLLGEVGAMELIDVDALRGVGGGP